MSLLSSSKKQITYPSPLYEYLVRKANAALGEKFIEISFPIIEIKFLGFKKKGSWNTVDWLYEELGKRLLRITQKYNIEISQYGGLKDLRIDYDIKSTFRQIIISNYHMLPLKSFGNMLTIIVWSYVVFALGKKPKEDETAQMLLKKYTDSLDQFKTYWNRMPRRKTSLDKKRMCYICGKPAYAFNTWIYRKKDTNEECQTPVCEKHRNSLV